MRRRTCLGRCAWRPGHRSAAAYGVATRLANKTCRAAAWPCARPTGGGLVQNSVPARPRPHAWRALRGDQPRRSIARGPGSFAANLGSRMPTGGVGFLDHEPGRRGRGGGFANPNAARLGQLDPDDARRARAAPEPQLELPVAGTLPGFSTVERRRARGLAPAPARLVPNPGSAARFGPGPPPLRVARPPLPRVPLAPPQTIPDSAAAIAD